MMIHVPISVFGNKLLVVSNLKIDFIGNQQFPNNTDVK
jgi:hypothetical protein